MAGIDRTTGRPIDNFTSALQGMETIFSTRIGDLITLREFGAGVLELIGRLVRPNLLAAFLQLVATAIDLWEPRFRVRRIVFLATESDLSMGILGLRIEVDYRPRAHLGDFTVERLTTFSLTFSGGSVKAME